MSIESQYLEGQEKCGIEEGDTVKVMRTAESHSRGWNDGWVLPMTEAIGQEMDVSEVDGNSGIILSNGYHYPYFVLEKVM